MASKTSTIDNGTITLDGGNYEFALFSVAKTLAAKNDDTLATKSSATAVSFLLADGATGFGTGHLASRALGVYFEESFAPGSSGKTAKSFLAGADDVVRRVADGGDTTGIVLSVSRREISGASAGDSEAWIFGSAGPCELTNTQRRRPRIGNGAYPQDFKGVIAEGDVLVVASDGLWNSVSQARVSEIVLEARGLDQACAALIAESRGQAGDHDDDVSVILLRRL
jgi:serine/threonine protein phosphatase PrpC